MPDPLTPDAADEETPDASAGGADGADAVGVWASDRPNAARMYDYWLGGKDNNEADREAADRLTDELAELPLLARSNRAYLGRAVRHLAAEHGFRQFLDIGSGLPTRSNVHQVAQAVDPGCRVVYVDHDPIVTRHARVLLAEQGQDRGRVGVLRYDVRETARLLDDPALHEVLDLREPVAVLMVALLHFIDGPPEMFHEKIFGPLAAALAPGSVIAFSHGVGNPRGPAATVRETYQRGPSGVGPVRSPEDVLALLPAPWRLVGSELVPVECWQGIGAPVPEPRRDRERTLWLAAGVLRLEPGA